MPNHIRFLAGGWGYNSRPSPDSRGSAILPEKFKKVGLIGRGRHDSSLETVQRLVHLLEARGLDISIEKRLASLLGEGTANITSRDDIGEHCDLVIVVGGDGSMLSAARRAISSSVMTLLWGV